MKHQPPQDLGPLFESATGRPEPKGETFDPSKDRARLARQYADVVAAMSDGLWHTLAYIASAANAPEASASARLRDMRRDGWVVHRRRVEGGNGLNEYRATRQTSSIGGA